ncbi:cytosolic protein [Salipaludibacillus sp. LMS25]|jgi:D-alanyl-D-alanine dipeptidase|uniref:cytosolic protein n=1 Tax=Salipaludibacillus sp. LMS25 TaxID=2924031 RepID=UPI0020D10DE0|nr:cytosolic protein [Salipaludibacillus sp. LMS25]UTR14071.1 cytosolic protein [Salipaludibacillus sp. LMS25]
MYVGRDMAELTMTPKTEWTEKELAYFHHLFQQISPYLSAEGVTIHREIVEEIMSRDGLTSLEAEWTSGTRPHFD